MASATSVCNGALLQIGGARITSIDGNSEKEKMCKELYEQTRDDLIRKHYWNCAMKRVSLAALSPGPDFGFDFHYQLPGDYIRVASVNRNDDLIDRGYSTRYRIENGKLLMDESPLNLLYAARIIDVNMYDANFRVTLEYFLASRFSIPVMNDKVLMKDMLIIAKDSLLTARTNDSHEGTPPDVIENDLILARKSGSSISDESRPFSV